MKQEIFEIVSQKRLTSDIVEINLKGNTDAITNCGQFVNIMLDGFYLRRPISICDYSEQGIKLIYKIVGSGTHAMSKLQAGDKLDILTGLGNGFNVNVVCQHPLVIGGGVGVPPIYRLTKELIKLGKKPTVILGFNDKNSVFYEDEFKALGVDVIVTTVDGSYALKGFVTDAIATLDYDYFFTCGPEPMLKAIYNTCKTQGQLSFEERMACGFGVCMGCSCETKYAYKRICKDGPVLLKDEVKW